MGVHSDNLWVVACNRLLAVFSFGDSHLINSPTMKTIIPRNMLPVITPSSFNDQDLSITPSVIPVKSKNDAVSNMDRGRFDSRSISLPQRPIPAVIAVDNPATMNIGPIIFWVIVFQPTSGVWIGPRAVLDRCAACGRVCIAAACGP